MLGEQAILDSQDIDHNPIHRPPIPENRPGSMYRPGLVRGS